MDKKITSGFVVEEESSFDKLGDFSNVVEIYASHSGVSRLLQGKRYGKLCIIKTLQKAYCGDTFSEQILRKEFAIGYQLSHPHICRTESWEHIPTLGDCIIMEYVDGTTLREYIEQKRITKSLATKWINELCQALSYLHSKQIIHRDLKPENILVTHNGNNIKLIDFSLSDQDDFDILKSPAGTRYYLAPEMLNDKDKVDSRSDIYSLGIIIGEIASVLNDKKLALISRRCTQSLPEKRYASIEEVISALNKRIYPVKSWPWVAAIVLFMFGGYFYYSTSKQTTSVQMPIYSNLLLDGATMKVLSEAWMQREQHTSADSLKLISDLKECMDRSYPLQQQQQTVAYKNQWKYILQQVDALYSSTMHSNTPQ